MTLTFNLRRAMVMTHTRSKRQGQKSVSQTARVETNKRADGHDRSHHLPANTVGKDAEMYKSQLLLTNPRDTLLHVHRVVHKNGRLVC